MYEPWLIQKAVHLVALLSTDYWRGLVGIQKKNLMQFK